MQVRKRNAWSVIMTMAAVIVQTSLGGGRFSGGPGGGSASAEAFGGLGAPPVWFFVDSPQVIERTLGTTVAATMTISNAAPAITTHGDLRLSIPETLPFTWDETVVTPVFGGTAADRVGSVIGYADEARTAVIDVDSDFAANDTLTVAGLSFTNLTRVCVAERLELDIHGDGQPDAWSDHGVRVTVWRPGGLGDGGVTYTLTADVPLRRGGTLLLIR